MEQNLISCLDVPVAPTQGGQATVTGLEVTVGVGVAIWASTVYISIYAATHNTPPPM